MFKTAVAIFAFLLVLHTQVVSANAPNVLWIISDDLSPELACYGYEGVATPNLDRLAGQGRRYTSAFATAPVCSSSRSAFITGVYQTSTGAHQHRTLTKSPLPDGIKTVVSLMKGAGYYVCNSDSSMKKSGKTDYNFEMDRDLYDPPDWSGRAKDQPFFAQVQIHEPHRGFDAAEAARRKKTFEIPSYYPDHPVIRADWANYLATIEELDRKVGLVIDRLESDGDLDNTVIFFFGDHGRPHYRDKQWLYDGGLRVPLIVRWPDQIEQGSTSDSLVSLIDVPAATIALAGIAIPDWMDGIDFLSAAPEGRDVVFAARDRCGSTLDRVRCVRTERFKYIRNFYPERPYSQHSGYKELQYPGMTVARVLSRRGELDGPANIFWAEQRPREELYDLESDPEELVNLAEDPKFSETLSELGGRLDRWIRETGDQGGTPEQGLNATIESSESWYRGAMKKRGFAPHPDPETYLQWWEKKLGVAR